MVDVGGGIGASAALPLARAFQNLNLIVQDAAEVVDQGRKVRK